MREIFGRYVHAGALSRDADALADLFTEDGVFEAPLVPDGHVFPNHLVGRDAIRAGMAEYYRLPAGAQGTVDTTRSSYVLHDTADPDVFIAEIDTVVDGVAKSLVQIVRLRDGKIARLRDYFAPDSVA
ncbi:nuclear transport factor 2 family protein [Kutzneria kofuensis]|uniref:Ketosteroid isomerase-like protein n=1 Tax=Kutzneria kofuensis TaxID=103725 RepID=A0A7W9KRG8_9PSEU|nr:nuclear transport factor 2 family protein [Kutzneria kofuensis]MBB5897388.1 ketosteroid isomerase-like protein [Kutzneria kofuensis]